MFNYLINGFRSEMEKIADLIPKDVFGKLGDYDKEKMINARDAIGEATKKDSKLSGEIRSKIIEGVFDSLKNMSYTLGNISNNVNKLESPKCDSVSSISKKKIKSL